jgi:hypothetical protein
MPHPILTRAVGEQGASQLLEVVGVVDLGEEIPFQGARIEGIQNDIAAIRSVEARKVRGVGIGNHGAIAAVERCGDKFANRRALSGPRGADQLEVLDFIARGNRQACEGQRGICVRISE